jgi:acetylornithine deacetylase/succinyl-diaminopimelate desuccinylase-like protein
MLKRLTLLAAFSCLALSAHAQSIEDEALAWLQDFIRVDTINPPGNETRAVEFIANILEAEGIPYQTAESAPGRGNLWARLEGGDEPALILLQHTDVVPADAYADMPAAIKAPGFMSKLQEHSAFLHALTRDTCSITRFEASNKINVVPPEAWAELDCRILPDRPSETFVNEMRELIKDTGVEISVIMAFTPAVSSTDSRLYRAIESVTAERHPGSTVMPAVSTGFTDSHFTRDLGIASYGFNPIVVPETEFSRIHGNDERVSVDAFKRGVSDHLAIIETVVYD